MLGIQRGLEEMYLCLFVSCLPHVCRFLLVQLHFVP
jgi:hypothetical protein